MRDPRHRRRRGRPRHRHVRRRGRRRRRGNRLERRPRVARRLQRGVQHAPHPRAGPRLHPRGDRTHLPGDLRVEQLPPRPGEVVARLQRVRQRHELAHGQDGALRHLRRHREQPARRRHRLVGRRPAQNAERIPLLRRRGCPSGRRVAADRRRSADRGNPEGRRPGLLQHHRRAARPRGRQHRPRHRLRGQARRRVHPLQGHEGRRAGHGRLLAGQGHGGEVLPHGAALRLRRRLRRQRPQAGAVDRRVLAEVHAERPHAGHDGRRSAAAGGRKARSPRSPACW